MDSANPAPCPPVHPPVLTPMTQPDPKNQSIGDSVLERSCEGLDVVQHDQPHVHGTALAQLIGTEHTVTAHLFLFLPPCAAFSARTKLLAPERQGCCIASCHSEPDWTQAGSSRDSFCATLNLRGNRDYYFACK
ncbi:UNVERIFIED_CONTAM: hypothetical protein FKN15_023440 [Acipenser sinensis]